jgi:hypothetical protein
LGSYTVALRSDLLVGEKNTASVDLDIKRRNVERMRTSMRRAINKQASSDHSTYVITNHLSFYSLSLTCDKLCVDGHMHCVMLLG